MSINIYIYSLSNSSTTIHFFNLNSGTFWVLSYAESYSTLYWNFLFLVPLLNLSTSRFRQQFFLFFDMLNINVYSDLLFWAYLVSTWYCHVDCSNYKRQPYFNQICLCGLECWMRRKSTLFMCWCVRKQVILWICLLRYRNCIVFSHIFHMLMDVNIKKKNPISLPLVQGNFCQSFLGFYEFKMI